MFGDKLAVANAKIASLVALIVATGFKIEAAEIIKPEGAVPGADSFKAHLEGQQKSAIDAALASANETLGKSESARKAYAGGLSAAGVKLVEGQEISADAIKGAVDLAIAAKSSKQIAAAGHPNAIELPVAVAGAGNGSESDASAVPVSAEEFLKVHGSIKDPVKRTEYFRKHSKRFPVR